MTQTKLPETAPELIELAKKIEGGPNASFTMVLPQTAAQEMDRLVAFAAHRESNPNRQTTALELYALAASVADNARDTESASQARAGAQRLLKGAEINPGVFAWKMNVEGNHFWLDGRRAAAGEHTVSYPRVIDAAHIKFSGTFTKTPDRPDAISGISQYTRERLAEKVAKLIA